MLTDNIFEILEIYSRIPKDQKKNIICTMDDVRGDFLGPQHGTTPAAVIANTCILDPSEAVKHSKREDGPYCTFSEKLFWLSSSNTSCHTFG